MIGTPAQTQFETPAREPKAMHAPQATRLSHPTIHDPEIGQTVPAGDPCPRCGVIREFWVYKPFTRAHQATAGWQLVRSQHCTCREQEQPLTTPAARQSTPAQRRQLQDYLDRNCPIPKAHTFVALTGRHHGHLRAAYSRATNYANSFQPRKETFGLYLAGPAEPGRDWLLDAIALSARAQGETSGRITAAALVARCVTSRPDYAWDPEAREHLRWSLRNCAVLAIAGIGATPATPVEWKELTELIDHRALRGLPTHFSAHLDPEGMRRAHEDKPWIAQLYLTIEAITRPAIYCPPAERSIR